MRKTVGEAVTGQCVWVRSKHEHESGREDRFKGRNKGVWDLQGGIIERGQVKVEENGGPLLFCIGESGVCYKARLELPCHNTL